MLSWCIAVAVDRTHFVDPHTARDVFFNIFLNYIFRLEITIQYFMEDINFIDVMLMIISIVVNVKKIFIPEFQID